MKELLRTITPQNQYFFKTAIMVFFVAVTYLFFRENGKKAWTKMKTVLNNGWLVLFLIYTAYLLTSTVLGRARSNPGKSVFGSFGLLKSNGTINTDLFANVLMCVPYTFLFLQAHRPEHPWKVSLMLSAGTTIFIEFSQLIGWLGFFQFADMIHNILGGMIGCGIWILIQRILARRNTGNNRSPKL